MVLRRHRQFPVYYALSSHPRIRPYQPLIKPFAAPSAEPLRSRGLPNVIKRVSDTGRTTVSGNNSDVKK